MWGWLPKEYELIAWAGATLLFAILVYGAIIAVAVVARLRVTPIVSVSTPDPLNTITPDAPAMANVTGATAPSTLAPSVTETPPSIGTNASLEASGSGSLPTPTLASPNILTDSAPSSTQATTSVEPPANAQIAPSSSPSQSTAAIPSSATPIGVATTASASTIINLTPSRTLTATLTQTSAPNATATTAKTFTATTGAAATATPTATVASSATPTATTLAGGPWSFINITLVPDPDPDETRLLLFGEMVNNTGQAQEISAVTGTFYDAGGNVIADDAEVLDFWPVVVIPAGERAAFELEVDGIQSAASYKLTIDALPSDEPPRQNFDFSDVAQTNEADAYCVSGKLTNPGDVLQDYLIIVATMYDTQGKVVNYASDSKINMTWLTGSRSLTFKLCAPPPNQNVARYEVRAWGR